MTRRLSIVSASNPRLKAVRRLARRRSDDVFLAEGSRALRSALAAGAPVREVYSAPALHLADEDAALVAQAERSGARVLEVDPGPFQAVARQVRPDGILAVVERPATALVDLVLPSDPLLVVTVGIERPGNLGAIIRTACAVGADALIVADPCTDPFQPDVVRGSVGSVFHLPPRVATSARAIAWLRRNSVRIVAASPGGTTMHRQASYGGAVAIALGSERHGLPEAWLDAAAETVAIPLVGPVDSLNVGVAAGVVLFEAAYARTAKIMRPTSAKPIAR